MLIDFHMHAFPDSIAENAVGKLSESSGLTPYCSATVADTCKRMDEAHIDIGVFLNIATNEKQQDNVNRFAKSCKRDRIVPFGSVYPKAGQAAVDAVHQIAADGLKGIKLHPEYQGFFPGEKQFFPIYDACREKNLIISFHAGKDISFPDTLYAPPYMFKQISREFPGLKIVAAHMGGFMQWDEVYDELAGSDVYLDTSFCSGYLPKDYAVKIIRKHGSQRILFGSDSPWHSSQVGLDYLDSLRLTDHEKELIVGKNAMELLGISG